MSNTIQSPIKMNSKTEQRLSISKREGDSTKETTVEPIENGYLVTIYESGYKKKANGDGTGYFSETKKFFSETNPLKTESKKDSKSEEKTEESIIKAIKGFMGDMGGHTLID